MDGWRDGEDLGRGGEGETIFRIYCIRFQFYKEEKKIRYTKADKEEYIG